MAKKVAGVVSLILWGTGDAVAPGKGTGEMKPPDSDDWCPVVPRKLKSWTAKPLPAIPPENGDPAEVHFLVVGDWGTFPGTGKGSEWPVSTWDQACFKGASSKEDWIKQKALGAPGPKWGISPYTGRKELGWPNCGSMHLECSWAKADPNGPRCNPDNEVFWRDHDAQKNVAHQMTLLAQKVKPSFVVQTGDAFYMAGVGEDGEKLQTFFEDIYPDASLQIPWLGTLGNHDYGGHNCDSCLWPELSRWEEVRRDRPCSGKQISYDTEHEWQWPAKKAHRWVMPMKGNDRFYQKSFSFPKAGVTVEIFVIDTNKAHVGSMCLGNCPQQYQGACKQFFAQLWERQKRWVTDAVEKSTAKWKIIVGHAPPENFEASLMDDLRGHGASVYMAGHVHMLRHDKHPSGMHVIVSGAGGGYQTAGGGLAYTAHQSENYGFAHVQATPTELTVKYINDQGTQLFDPIVIPYVDAAALTAVKRLQEASVKGDVEAMKTQIAKSKELSISDNEVYRAALSGAMAMQMDGGMARLKIHRGAAGYEGNVPAVIADWTLANEIEDKLPTGRIQLAYDSENSDGCGDIAYPESFSGKAVLFKAGVCTAAGRARRAAKVGATMVVLVSTSPTLPKAAKEENGDVLPDPNDALVLPLVSLGSGDPWQHIGAAWPVSEVEVEIVAGTAAADQALQAARSAGVPEEMVVNMLREVAQAQAKVQLLVAQSSDDIAFVREAIRKAKESGLGSDEVEDGMDRLVVLETLGHLQMQAEITDFAELYALYQTGKAKHVNYDFAENGTAYKHLQVLAKAELDITKTTLPPGNETECRREVELRISHCQVTKCMPVNEDGEMDGSQVYATLCAGKSASGGDNTMTYVMIALGVVLVGVAVFLFSKSSKPAVTVSQEPLRASQTELGEVGS